MTGRDRTEIVCVGPSLVDDLSETFDTGDVAALVRAPSAADDVLDRIARNGRAVDAVVCEHAPPAVDAIDLASAVRSERPTLPTVVLTDDGDESLAARAVSADVTAYVSVGETADSLSEVASLIERHARAADGVPDHPDPDGFPGHLVEQNIVGVYEMRGETLTYVNPTFAEILGYEREELLGASAFDLVAEREHPRLRENMERLARGDVERNHTAYTGVRKDGTERIVEVHGTVIDRSSEPIYLGFVRDVTDRERRERRFEAVFNNTYQFTGLMEPDGTMLEANETALSFGGLDRAEVVGTQIWDTGWFRPNEAARTAAREAVETARNGELFRDEVRVQGAERELVIDFSVRPVTDERGNVTLLIPEGRNVTQRKRREARSAGLNDVLAELFAADTRERACDVVADTAADRLDLPVALVALLDEADGSLRPVARSDAAAELLDEGRLLAPDDGPAWRAFVDGELHAVDVESPAPRDARDVDELIVAPLGGHGVLIVGSPWSDDEFARTVAENVRTALDRIEREELLRDREELLEERNESLDRVNRLNELIRGIDRALVGSSTRSEMERAVCAELTGGDAYAFAWIAEHEPSTGRIIPRQRAGEGDDYVEAVTFAADGGPLGDSPTERALLTRETQVMDSVFTEPPYESWREAAINRGYRSAVAIPLLYRDSLYGVLTIYADRPEAFDDLERRILTELGETVAHAINSVESKRALVADDAVVLDLRVDDADDPLIGFVGDAPGRALELEGVVPAEDDTFRVYCRIEGATPEAISALTRRAAAVDGCRRVADRGDGTLYECTIGEGSLIFWLIDRGAVPRSLSVDEDGGRIRVELAGDADVRDFVELFRAAYPGSELIASRERREPAATTHRLDAALAEVLTARQREVLRTAYFSGYFNTPRDRSGEEVADSIGIAQPTFSAHLRAAQRNLFAPTFEGDGEGPAE